MTPDDYDDFIAWKRGLNKVYSNAYLKRHKIHSSEYANWKVQNDISMYDEKVLIKLYALEKQVDRLESILYKALDG